MQLAGLLIMASVIAALCVWWIRASIGTSPSSPWLQWGETNKIWIAISGRDSKLGTCAMSEYGSYVNPLRGPRGGNSAATR